MRSTLDATATPKELMEADDATPPATTDVDPVDAMKHAVLNGDTRTMSRTLLRSSGPRLLRDILGPTLSFYAGWKVTGSLLIGVALGTTFSFAAYRYERHHGRPGAIARLVLAFVVLQALIGLATGSAKGYLIQPSILGLVNGAVWLGSVVVGKPLAAVFAHEVFPIDEQTRASDEFHLVFRHVSLVFGAFFLVFAAVQLVVLVTIGVDAFVAVRVLDALGILALIVYSVRYAVDRLAGRMEPTS
jgi:intracellular septation protein A